MRRPGCGVTWRPLCHSLGGYRVADTCRSVTLASASTQTMTCPRCLAPRPTRRARTARRCSTKKVSISLQKCYERSVRPSREGCCVGFFTVVQKIIQHGRRLATALPPRLNVIYLYMLVTGHVDRAITHNTVIDNSIYSGMEKNTCGVRYIGGLNQSQVYLFKASPVFFILTGM